jgi:hypothetical protein
LARFSAIGFLVIRFFCPKSSIEWTELDQFTTKMAPMKDYTNALNIIELKLVKVQKNSKKDSK